MTRFIRRLPLAAVALFGSLTVHAQATPPATSTIPIAFSGEVRARSEWDRPGGGVAADAFTYLRSRFGARIDPAPGARIVLQVQDSRVLGAENNRSATAPDVFDLHQGFVELTSPIRRVASTLRAGRQEIALGNERLVGAVNWSNTGRSFDGARLTIAPVGEKAGAERWTASLFAATMEERGRRFGTSADSSSRPPDHSVAGLFVARRIGPSTLETTALYDGGAHYRTYDRSNRATLDTRWRASRVVGVSLELEGAYQFGSQRYVSATPGATREQRVGAWLAGARVGTADVAGRPVRLTLGADVLSGDRSPADGRYGAFNTMFATNHPFYGLMDLFLDPAARTKDGGLVDTFATGTFTLTPDVTLRSELHHFALETGSDAPLGWEGDIVLPMRLNGVAGIDVGYTVFRAERGARAIGLGAEGTYRNWAYVQLRAGF